MASGSLTSSVGIDQALLGIGAEIHRVGDAIACRQALYAITDCLDATDTLHTDHRGQVTDRVHAAAAINIDVVQTTGGLLQAYLARAWSADRDLFPLQYFGSASLMNSNCSCHAQLSAEKNRTMP